VIERLDYAGTGCSAGTLLGPITVPAAGFAVDLGGISAASGPGVPLAASRRNCQLSFTLAVPAGWQFALTGVDFSGGANLSSGSRGSQLATSYFAGDLNEEQFATTLVGPLKGDYVTRNTTVDTLVWSNCGETRNLEINAELRARGTGTMGGASDTGSVEQAYHLQWLPCGTAVSDPGLPVHRSN
jgi:hypothetical protein